MAKLERNQFCLHLLAYPGSEFHKCRESNGGGKTGMWKQTVQLPIPALSHAGCVTRSQALPSGLPLCWWG